MRISLMGVNYAFVFSLLLIYESKKKRDTSRNHARVWLSPGSGGGESTFPCFYWKWEALRFNSFISLSIPSPLSLSRSVSLLNETWDEGREYILGVSYTTYLAKFTLFHLGGGRIFSIVFPNTAARAANASGRPWLKFSSDSSQSWNCSRIILLKAHNKFLALTPNGINLPVLVLKYWNGKQIRLVELKTRPPPSNILRAFHFLLAWLTNLP